MGVTTENTEHITYDKHSLGTILITRTMSFDQSVSLTNMGWGPEAGPWSYRKLSGSTLDAELSRLAFAKTVRETDCVVSLSIENSKLNSKVILILSC